MTVSRRLAKLRAMPIAEIGGRVGERLYAQWERWSTTRGSDRDETLRAGLVESLRSTGDWKRRLLANTLAQRPGLFPSLDQPEILTQVLLERFAPGAERAVA